MRAMALLGLAAVVIGGCALEAQDDAAGDEGTGEAHGAASAFTASWSTTHVVRTRPIVVPIGSTIKVTAKADFSDPVGCPSAYTAELIQFAGGEEVIGIARAYPRNQTHTEIWTALVAGTYRVQFSTMRPPKACSLLGTVTVNVTP